jgi:hypothetical protein
VDTVQKKEFPADTILKASAPVSGDSALVSNVTDTTVSATDHTEAIEEEVMPVTPVKTKTNTKLWKEYTDSLTASLKDEVLSSKKVKKDAYFFLVEYEIDENGQVTIGKVTISPDNEFLLNHVRERILTTPPVLNPVAKKVKRRQSFTIVKD